MELSMRFSGIVFGFVASYGVFRGCGETTGGALRRLLQAIDPDGDVTATMAAIDRSVVVSDIVFLSRRLTRKKVIARIIHEYFVDARIRERGELLWSKSNGSVV